MAAKLKKEFLKLLEEDREFRYTVAGILGFSEILKRLDASKRTSEKYGKKFEASEKVRKNSALKLKNTVLGLFWAGKSKSF